MTETEPSGAEPTPRQIFEAQSSRISCVVWCRLLLVLGDALLLLPRILVACLRAGPRRRDLHELLRRHAAHHDGTRG